MSSIMTASVNIKCDGHDAKHGLRQRQQPQRPSNKNWIGGISLIHFGRPTCGSMLAHTGKSIVIAHGKPKITAIWLPILATRCIKVDGHRVATEQPFWESVLTSIFEGWTARKTLGRYRSHSIWRVLFCCLRRVL